jgi:hypothetical protein
VLVVDVLLHVYQISLHANSGPGCTFTPMESLDIYHGHASHGR